MIKKQNEAIQKKRKTILCTENIGLNINKAPIEQFKTFKKKEKAAKVRALPKQ